MATCAKAFKQFALLLLGVLALVSSSFAQNTPAGPQVDRPSGEVWRFTLGDETRHPITYRGTAIVHAGGLSLHILQGKTTGSTSWVDANFQPLELTGSGPYEVGFDKLEVNWETFDFGNGEIGKLPTQLAVPAQAQMLTEFPDYASLVIYTTSMSQMVGEPITRQGTAFGIDARQAKNGSQVIRPGLRLTIAALPRSGDIQRIAVDWWAEYDRNELIKAESSAEQNSRLIFTKGPEIIDILIASDQKGRSESGSILFPKPATDTSVERGSTHPEKDRRRLIILGRNLDQIKDLPIRATNSNSPYSAPVELDAAALTKILNAYDRNADDEEAIELARQREGQDDLQAYTVTVDVANRTEASKLKFEWDIVEGEWPLRFGEIEAEIAITRPLSSNIIDRKNARPEKTLLPGLSVDPVYFRDELVFEARLDDEADIGELTLKFDNSLEEISDGDGAAFSAILKKTENDPKLYRSRSYVVVDRLPLSERLERFTKENASTASAKNPLPPKSTFFDGQSDDDSQTARDTILQRTELSETGENRDQQLRDEAKSISMLSKASTSPLEDYKDVPPDFAIQVLSDTILLPRLIVPSSLTVKEPLPNPVVKHTKDVAAGSYIEALIIAANCTGQSLISNSTGELSLKEARSLSFFRVPFISNVNEVELNLGNHAALILIRDRLNDLLQQGLDATSEAQKIDQLSPEFTRQMYRLVQGKPSQLGLIAYLSPVKSMLAFLRQQEKANTAPLTDSYAKMADSFSKLLDVHRGNLSEAKAILNQSDLCDPRSLLGVVGRGMGPVIADLQSRITRMERNEKTEIRVRRPDPIARVMLAQVAGLMNQYDTALDYSDAQWKTVSAAIGSFGLATGVGAAYTGLASLAAVSAAADMADLSAKITENMIGARRDADLKNLAKGVRPIVGKAASEEITEKVIPLRERITETAISAAGAYASRWDAIDAVTKRSSRSVLDAAVEVSKGKKTSGLVDAQTRQLIDGILKRAKADPTTLSKLSDNDFKLFTETLKNRRMIPQRRALRELQSELNRTPGLNGLADTVTPDGKTVSDALKNVSRKAGGAVADTNDAEGLAKDLSGAIKTLGQ